MRGGVDGGSESHRAHGVSPFTHAHSARLTNVAARSLARAQSMTSAARHRRLLLARSGPGGSDEGETQSFFAVTVYVCGTFSRLVAA